MARKTEDDMSEGRVDLDTHADTCVLGRTFVVLEDTGQRCDVTAYDNKNKRQDVAVVKGATAYDTPDGTTYILVFNQALRMEEQDPSLICPNQMRAFGMQVKDVPGIWDNGDMAHTISAPETGLRINLDMHGVVSCFHSRIPTAKELEDCEWITMTGESTWDPHSDKYEKQELRRKEQEDIPVPDRNRTAYAFRRCDPETRVLATVSSTLADDDFMEDIEDTVVVTLASAQSTSRGSELTPEFLSRQWGIGLQSAKNTIRVTTQKGIRSFANPIHRRYRTNQQQMKYNRLNTRFYSDTFFAQTKSVNGNTCQQIFVNTDDYTRVYPMKSKADAHCALTDLFTTVGVPRAIHTDGASELTEGEWRRKCQLYDVEMTRTEAHSPWQNRAEGSIREHKRMHKRIAARTKTPKPLWDYLSVYVSEIRSLTARCNAESRTGMEAVTGNTPDITEWLDFGWYVPVWYWDSSEPFPGDSRKVARWIGVAHRVGQALCYWILPESGIPIARSTVQAWSDDELRAETTVNQLKQYDESIKRKLPEVDVDGHEMPLNLRFEDEEDNDIVEHQEPGAEMPEADDYDEEAFDKYITAQVLLGKGSDMSRATVTNRKRDANGHPIGMSNSNPLLDTRLYEVTFDDGTVGEYAANVIAEALYAQVDDEGNEFLLMEEITDHEKTGDAMHRDDMFVTARNGNKHMRRTTKGWKLLIKWKDGSTSWERLADLKESNPVQVAEYAVANKIESEPAFAWWVKDVLRRRDRIIAKVKSRYWKRTHKYGIQVPKTVEEALRIDKETNTTLWETAIKKEMKNVMTAFKILEEDENVPVGSQLINCHMIFDVKLDFTRKARFVAGGHMTDPPASLTYASVVSRDSVRIALLIAALNDLDVLCADVSNAYINATCREKTHFKAGSEFGPNNQGRMVIIVRALYGLKSSGAAWRAHLAQTMSDMGFVPCEADPDVWMRPGTKADGFKYYELVLIYTDDILAVSSAPAAIMEAIADLYDLKQDPKTKKRYDEPTRYLGATIGRYTFEDEQARPKWYMSSEEYVKNSIIEVEKKLEGQGKYLSTKISTPITQKYRPEVDVTPELNDANANYYQNLIGILRWTVELGRIDIHVAVSLMSSFSAAPREGHLEQLYHVFAYLKKHKRSKIVFDDTIPGISEGRFQNVDWQDFYPDAKEPRSPKEPEARGREVKVSCFVDADHAGDLVTRRSHTGILIYVNRAPIIWFSKKQNTVETSTFGSEFVAMKAATEKVQALRYKLRMMGIPIDGPADMFCDNEAVVKNTSRPESTLKKKHLAIAFHRVREAAASGLLRIAKEDTETNLADMLTKPLAGPRLKELIRNVLY